MINQKIYEKVNPNTKTLFNFIKGRCSVCGRKKSQIFNKKMTRGESFIEDGKCKLGHRSPMSNSAWCDLNKDCNNLNLHDMCHNPKCNCQKQNIFTPEHFQLEGGSIENKLQKIFKGTRSAWSKYLKPAINGTAPFIDTAVSAKSKNQKVGQATTNVLKSISGGTILSLTDVDKRGFRLKVM